MENIIEGFKMLPQPTLYIVVGIIGFAVIALLFRVARGVKKTAKIIKGDKYRKNPKGQDLTQAQQRALNIGAVNGEQTMYYVDSLVTGDAVANTAQNLSNYYGIGKGMGMTPAEQMLMWLYQSGHRVFFESMKDVFAASQNKEWKRSAEELYSGDELEKCISFMDNLEECLPVLIEKGYLADRSDMAGISIAAWDMGRLVNITRGCFECHYINESRAWEIINNALEVSKENYGSWKEFAAGYVIGRAMWGGNNLTLNGIINIAQGLLNDEESPWRKQALK